MDFCLPPLKLLSFHFSITARVALNFFICIATTGPGSALPCNALSVSMTLSPTFFTVSNSCPTSLLPRLAVDARLSFFGLALFDPCFVIQQKTVRTFVFLTKTCFELRTLAIVEKRVNNNGQRRRQHLTTTATCAGELISSLVSYFVHFVDYSKVVARGVGARTTFEARKFELTIIHHAIVASVFRHVSRACG